MGAIAASKNSKRNTGRKTYSKTRRSNANNAAYAAQRSQNIEIQKALNLYGFNVGRADGALGPKSKAGIRQFQIANGFAPTGQLTPHETQMLLSVPFQVENALYQNGFSVGVVDGKTDQQTAIAQFQGKLGEMPTGQLTPDQTNRLISEHQSIMANQTDHGRAQWRYASDPGICLDHGGTRPVFKIPAD